MFLSHLSFQTFNQSKSQNAQYSQATLIVMSKVWKANGFGAPEKPANWCTNVLLDGANQAIITANLNECCGFLITSVLKFTLVYANRLKVSKSRKQFLELSILPKNKQKTLKKIILRALSITFSCVSFIIWNN